MLKIAFTEVQAGTINVKSNHEEITFLVPAFPGTISRIVSSIYLEDTRSVKACSMMHGTAAMDSH